ncbi:ATP-binding protein [Actinophytocola sp.]|uniref:sensor histidine kinase n=1 Tax=Actinophytocola sp. TaxID=1872138 RepID=UPI002D379DF1|nr:ATP-binding protein [Actinophytocola sp.]HYQ67143.1 ATP-binding protein [Actinophytocola sp.]
MGSGAPEPTKRVSTRWRIDNWNLRTKVAAVLLLPAVIALVLGAIRVEGRLDEANRLSTIRDQMVVLGESLKLADLVVDEMITAVINDPAQRPRLRAQRAAVDQQVIKVRNAVDFAQLPPEVDRTLSDSLGRLAAVRVQTSNDVGDPVTDLAAYQEVVNGLTELVPGVVGVAQSDDLDELSNSVRALVLLRSALAAEEALIRFAGQPPQTPQRIASAAQQSAAEERVLGEQLQIALPEFQQTDFSAATETAPTRRATLQDAVVTPDAVDLRSLLPNIQTEASRVRDLSTDLVNFLGDTVTNRTNDARSAALRDTAIVIAALLIALAVALVVSRSLLDPVRRLRQAALTAAREQLPRAVERVRAGEQISWSTRQSVPVRTTEEIGQLARAFDDMHEQAIRLAAEQAELRRQVSEMFMTLSRRSQTLVESQLEVIEGLESDEQDPRRLSGLFRLDHLATRLRRNGENLQVLAGGSPARRDSAPVTVVELLRAATSEIDDYRRITLAHAPSGSVRAVAAADVVHILSELLENATRYSPPDQKVVLSADRGADGGLLFEVVDAGLGMASDDIEAANHRLAATDYVGPETTRRMGLFVVSRLAARHGVTVRLRPTFERASRAGITASIHLPGALVIAGTTPENMVTAVATRRELVAATAKLEPTPIWPTAHLDHGTDHRFEEFAAAQPATSSWFVEETYPDTGKTGNGNGGNGEGNRAPHNKWLSPTARPAAEQTPARQAATTSAGLPVRTPGARAVPTERSHASTPDTGFRDPESIRNNLSRHYDGVLAARRAREEPEPGGNGKGSD